MSPISTDVPLYGYVDPMKDFCVPVSAILGIVKPMCLISDDIITSTNISENISGKADGVTHDTSETCVFQVLLLFSSSVTSKPDPVGILFYMPLFAEKGDDIMAIATMEYIMNGQTYQLQKDLSTGKYKKVLTAPAKSSYSQPNHVYATTLKVKDQAGNVTTIDQGNAEFGSKMKLDVNEKVPPVITPTKPGDEAYLTSNSVQIQFDVTDNDSGVAQGSISLQIDNQAAITTGLTKTEIAGGYRCAYTANIADGDHTIKLMQRIMTAMSLLKRQSLLLLIRQIQS